MKWKLYERGELFVAIGSDDALGLFGVKGKFIDGNMEGKWIRYDKQVAVEYHAEFDNGKLIKKIK